MTTIEPAPEAEQIAQDLIAEVHKHLTEATILYLFTSSKRKRHDKVILGTAQKISALQRYLSGANCDPECDFIILISKNEWQTLNPAQRKALVDHELCHCVCKQYDEDGEPVWGLRAHDIEEFKDIIERHGLWKSDVSEFANSIRQLAFPETEAI